MKPACSMTLLLVSCLLATTTSTPARAEDSSASATSSDEAVGPGQAKPQRPSDASTPSIGVEAYWWSAKNLGSVLPIIPFGSLALSPSLRVDLHLPFAIALNSLAVSGVSDSGASSALAIGNPTVGLSYVASTARTTGLIGARISAPLTGVSDSPPWRGTTGLATFGMALWDVHYWANDYLPVGLRLAGEHQAAEVVLLRGALEPTLYIPLASTSSAFLAPSRSVELYYQARVEAEFRHGKGFGGGLAVQVFHALSASSGGDNAQLAAEPFVSYQGESAFARLGVVTALDEPLGFGFDRGRVAALRLTVGTHLE